MSDVPHREKLLKVASAGLCHACTGGTIQNLMPRCRDAVESISAVTRRDVIDALKEKVRERGETYVTSAVTYGALLAMLEEL